MIFLVKKIDPFFKLKFEYVKTYHLVGKGLIVAKWYDNGSRPISIDVGNLVKGIVLRRNGVINYNKSKPEVLNKQLKLL
tara:strand:- start:806 stop:1042 length:237 start_codon:yes stop_codon:yes gene_type:complete